MDRPNPITPGLLIGFAIAVAFGIALPHLVSDFITYQFTLAMAWAIAMLGLNVLTGYNGQFSIGHSAFFAAGAYSAAIFIDHFGWGPYEAIVAAALISFVFGFLFGLPALRLEGLYLALATFALAVATPQLLKFDAFEHWTGGVQGIYVPKPDPIVSDYEVAFSEVQILCAQEGKKAKLRRETMRTITSYTTADFDCVSLSSDTKTSGNVSNLPAPPNYK